MAYFGGGGVAGELHPSLRVYIQCFMSTPFPKVYPRGGGPFDQDPMLMRDFRLIRDSELKWKESNEQLERHKAGSEEIAGEEGGVGGLGDALDEYIQELEADEDGGYG